MRMTRLVRLSSLVAVVLAGAFVGIGSVGAAGSAPVTCSGGSIPSGTYSTLTVSGACSLDSGAVIVQGDLNVVSGGALFADFGGSDLIVGQNLNVNTNSVLVLGCEPGAFICINDTDQTVGTMMTHDLIGGNLIANGALAIIVHKSVIDGDASVIGGGGGVSCDPPAVLYTSPAFGTFEDNVIGHDAVIAGWQSCWLGFIRNTVVGDVSYDQNVTLDPDANEVVTNVILGKLNCFGNAPAPQIGDSMGSLNEVPGGATGQCQPLVAP